MSKGALIVGGSVAGIQAAFDLADAGIHVHLVEPAPFVAASATLEQEAAPRHLVNTRLLELAKHANVTMWTNTQVQAADCQAGRFRLELRQQPRHVDLQKCTACGDCVAACPVTVPGTDHKAIFIEAGGQPGCAAIDKLGQSPCAATCPGGIHVQGYIALAAQGRFQEAIDLIREAIPFPGICGRICTHPCELNCRRAEVDTAVAIRPLKRFLADWELEQGTSAGLAPETRVGSQSTAPVRRVAVVGAGPAGMTVADQLAARGYAVTVFEKLPVIGGMMAVGIPEYRLPRGVIAREYQRILNHGVEIRLNTTIGAGGDYSLDDLFAQGYEAVCLAIGAHRSHLLRIPGEELPGVVQGIELLKLISLSQQLDSAEYRAALQQVLRRGAATRVAVLGGGNTAMDVSRSLRRFGIKDVRILYRRTRAEMPAAAEEIEEAEHEGVAIEFLVAPLRVLGDPESGVVGLECQRMLLGEPDTSGRRRPRPIAGTEHVVDLDLVVLAIGQSPELEILGPDSGHGLAITRAERIGLQGSTFATSRPGVFAAGDAVTQDKMVVIEAIGMGKKAAAEIDDYLQGKWSMEAEVAPQRAVARRELSDEDRRPRPRTAVPAIPREKQLDSYAEVETGYSPEQAIVEAGRCLACGPCSECLACVRACKPGAIIHEQTPRNVDLSVDAIICAASPQKLGHLSLPVGAGCYQVTPDSPVQGSAAAARVMYDLLAEGRGASAAGPSVASEAARVGVFVCQCGGEIGAVVDTEALRNRAATWPDVAHSQVLPFSCSPEAAEAMASAAAQHSLNRVLLAACSCCALDQVCYSCTYQRVRCKDNLGLFRPGAALAGRPDLLFEFVNVREQCAWAHAGDPKAATAKATALLAAGLARLRTAVPRFVPSPIPERTALILGRGAAAEICRQVLESSGISARHIAGRDLHVERSGGSYVLAQDGTSWQGSALVLAPDGDGEREALLSACGQEGRRPRIEARWGGVDTHRPGIFYCEPALEATAAGAAAAARVAAWLGRIGSRQQSTTAVVDAARCRACGTCVQICEFGAPQLVGQDPRRASWIDPAICTGCGTCAAHCPSGAITAGYGTGAQLEAALEQMIGYKGQAANE